LDFLRFAKLLPFLDFLPAALLACCYVMDESWTSRRSATLDRTDTATFNAGDDGGGDRRRDLGAVPRNHGLAGGGPVGRRTSTHRSRMANGGHGGAASASPAAVRFVRYSERMN
jgi:hypothetical protein